MKFFDYSEDERREWRESDITKAYIARVLEEAVDMSKAAIGILSSGDDEGFAAAVKANQGVGLARATEIANEVTK